MKMKGRKRNKLKKEMREIKMINYVNMKKVEKKKSLEDKEWAKENKSYGKTKNKKIWLVGGCVGNRKLGKDNIILVQV